IHLTEILAFPEGVGAAEAEEAYQEKLAPGPTPKDFPPLDDTGVFSGIFSAGLGARLEFEEGTFVSGRTFIFACFVADREGGESHEIAYGQYEIVTIE
ncbi:MAG: hypothetical protein WB297_03280, partial [Actinomycetota bacterium]